MHFEEQLSADLDLPFYPVSTQTCTRKQDLSVINELASLGASLHKFAFDLRVLQSPSIGEVNEYFAPKQVGSSAMPFKRNPINAEKVDSLARQLSAYPQVAWQNAAVNLLERTLDDSANRRTILPESFLICDELLAVMLKLVSKMTVDRDAIRRNFEVYAPFACTERIMMALSKKGADRQETHELLRNHAMQSWQTIKKGEKNPLTILLSQDTVVTKWLKPSEIEELIDVSSYTGISSIAAREMVVTIHKALQ